MPPTVEQLSKVFEVYLNEIALCRARRCHFAMFHILVCVPDICCSLAGVGGNSTQTDYIDWCDLYLKTLPLNGSERWELRNKLLHRGWSAPNPAKVGRYSNYTYGQPGTGGGLLGTALVIDLGQLQEEILGGLRAWWGDVEAGTATGHANVLTNMGSVVKAAGLPIPTYSPGAPAGTPPRIDVLSVTSGTPPIWKP